MPKDEKNSKKVKGHDRDSSSRKQLSKGGEKALKPSNKPLLNEKRNLSNKNSKNNQSSFKQSNSTKEIVESQKIFIEKSKKIKTERQIEKERERRKRRRQKKRREKAELLSNNNDSFIIKTDLSNSNDEITQSKDDSIPSILDSSDSISNSNIAINDDFEDKEFSDEGPIVSETQKKDVDWNADAQFLEDNLTSADFENHISSNSNLQNQDFSYDVEDSSQDGLLSDDYSYNEKTVTGTKASNQDFSSEHVDSYDPDIAQDSLIVDENNQKDIDEPFETDISENSNEFNEDDNLSETDDNNTRYTDENEFVQEDNEISLPDSKLSSENIVSSSDQEGEEDYERENEYDNEGNEVDIDREKTTELAQEINLKQNRFIEAQQLSQNLQDEEPVSLLLKQDIFGKFFDFLLRFFKNRKKKLKNEFGEDMEQVIYKPLFRIIKIFAATLAISMLMFVAFLIGSNLRVFDFIGNLLSPLSLIFQERVVESSPKRSESTQSVDLTNYPALQTLKIFGLNSGDATDVIDVLLKTTAYFGKMKDPVLYGETGITAVAIYGLFIDEKYEQNKFVSYVEHLRLLNNFMTVDVYEMLDSVRERELKLAEYLSGGKQLLSEAKRLRVEVMLQADDLKVAHNSLNLEKQRQEVDYFASLQKFSGEDAIKHINSFIEISQKQIELKAKMNGLLKLLEFFDDVLIKIETRLFAVEKNRDALISGIRIVDVPGSGLSLIVNPSKK